MTKAEEMEINLSNDPDYDVFETATIHYTKDDDVVWEYQDGSVLSFAEGMTNHKGERTFVSMQEMLESMSEEEEVDAHNLMEAEDESGVAKMGYRGDVRTLEGTLSPADWHYFVDLPFELSGVTYDGVPYPRVNLSDWKGERGDVYPIVYTAELAANIGKRVRVKCLVSTFREKRSSARGVPYFVDVDYLHAPSMVAVVCTPRSGEADV